MAYNMRGVNNPFYGKHHTSETKEKLRLSRLGSGEGKSYEKTYGKHTHRVIAEQMLGRPLRKDEIVHHIDGNKHNNDPSNLRIMTQSEHAKIHFMRKVKCIDTNIVYDGITEASKYTNTNASAITQCCRGHQKSAGGFHWKYVKGGDDDHV